MKLEEPITRHEWFAKSVHLNADGADLTADWIMPPNPLGIVLFAHGSGSSRHSSRNKAVARQLVERGIGTFLLDLLTLGEEQIDAVTRHLRFNIPFLGKRLVEATRWISDQYEARGLSLGYFGASTGSAAALVAAAGMKHSISAVVSRGGRPDLAGRALSLVTAPTLLLVGGNDTEVEQLNRQAMTQMRCKKKLVIIPGATHLFEEPGTLDQVAVDASDWFADHFNHHGNPGLKPSGALKKGGL